MRNRKGRRQQQEPGAADTAPDATGDTRMRPEQPANWRDVVRTDYGYPDEVDELSRRERRRTKRDWRRDDHAQRMAWLRERRQAEPTSPVAVIVAVAILAIIVLGFGGGLPRLLGDDEPASRDIGLLTPTVPPEQPLPVDPTSVGTSTSILSPPSTPSPAAVPPVLTERPPAAAKTSANDVTSSWARAFYTRDPGAETYTQLVARVAQFTTDEVADSFTAAGDSTYEALRTNGGKSTVVSAAVVAPRPEAAPVDTPNRISRLVTVVIDITGKQPERVTLPLLVTLIPQDGGRWVISDVNGGSGP